MSRRFGLSGRSVLARLAVPAIAAALAIGVTAPIVADQVTAQPARHDRDRGDRDDARRRAELDKVRAELAQYQQAYNELSAGLARVEQLNRKNRDRRLATQVTKAIRDAERRAAQFVQPWAYDQKQPQLPHRPAPAKTHAMSDRDFRSLSDQIGRASFSDDKLGLVQTAAQTNYFTVAQVVTLMQLASFDDTRIEIAVACAPRVIDGDKWFQVYGALSFSSSKETLRTRLGGR